jgi:autophagy-related protein 9
MVHEDEGLWDELSHQQSREIQQYQQETVWQPPSAVALHSIRTLETAGRLARTAASEVGRFAHVVYEAGTAAYHQQQERQRIQCQRTNTNPTTYLEEFGIPKEAPLLDNDYMDYTAFDEQQQRPAHQNGNPRGENDFVFLPSFRLQPHRDGWGAVANLDVFFSSLYSYYYHRGLIPIIGKGVVELVTLFFTLFLSVFVSAYVDWKALSSCIDEASCRPTFKSYLIRNPFAHWSLWNTIVILYILLFAAYGLVATLSLVHTIQQALHAKFVFEDRLGISARKLEGGAVEWDRDVVSKLLELQTSGEYRIAIHGQDLDALVIAQRILRKENFMVALFNRGLLDLTIPYSIQPFFCPSLEWSIYFCVINFMFNHKYHIRPAFYLDPAALRRRFILCGIAHAIFMPFLLFFMTLHFGLQNAYDWKSTKQYLGPREWSLSAKWTFRELNELPHHFERRLSSSYKAAEGYLFLFGQNEVVVALGRILVFIGGSLGALLFAFAAMNDAILLHVKIADWNLLWYAGVVGVVYSAGKAMLPTAEAQPRSSRNLFAEIDDALANVATYTHHYPDTWRGRGWDQSTYKAFSTMFKYKAQLFMMEVASVFLAPYILCVSLARCADPICEFVLATKADVPGAGEVCGYATFDFDRYSDEMWEGRTLGTKEAMFGTLTESILRSGNVEEATRQFPKPKMRHGKMEKSFFSFKTCHPGWKYPESGQLLVDRLERYQREEASAISREQQAHVEAAARQLETLARLENGSTEPNNPTNLLNDAYLRRVQTLIDAEVDTVPLPKGISNISGSNGLAMPQSSPTPLTAPVHTNPLQEDVSCSSVVPTTSYPRPSSSSTVASGLRSTLPSNAALSTELRRILNLSTLDSDISFAGSVIAGDALDSEERRAERQYLWLERYHNHIAAQHKDGNRNHWQA